MMKLFSLIGILVSVVFLGYKGNVVKNIKSVSKGKEEKYYYKSLTLAKENRLLKQKISTLNFNYQKMKSKNHYLKMKVSKNSPVSVSKRKIASYAPVTKFSFDSSDKDFVQDEIYQWGEYKLYTIALREYKLKNFEKSSQFFVELINQYPESKYLNESVLLKSAFSCYQTKTYYKQAINILDLMLRKHPHSKHYLKAKLWRGLSYFHSGNFKEFYSSVEEFRKKYRNTKEWSILRNYYEKIIVRSQNI